MVREKAVAVVAEGANARALVTNTRKTPSLWDEIIAMSFMFALGLSLVADQYFLAGVCCGLKHDCNRLSVAKIITQICAVREEFGRDLSQLPVIVNQHAAC